MKYCKKCLYPDTKPQLIFDKNGICSACNNSNLKDNINWVEKENELKKILEKYRSKDATKYDCIIPVSGGKDSTYQTLTIKKKFKLNPLVVNFHPIDQTELGRENLENLKKIGVDCIEFSPNPEVYLRLARFGLKELGDFQWPEHLGIFTIPVKIAVLFDIPLIIWGENPQLEYGQPTDIEKDTILDREWNEKNGGYFLDKIKPQDMIKYGFELSDLRPYIYPADEDIKRVGVTGIFLGTYLKWNIFKQLEIVKEIGFKENLEKRYSNVECVLSSSNIDQSLQFYFDVSRFQC